MTTGTRELAQSYPPLKSWKRLWNEHFWQVVENFSKFLNLSKVVETKKEVVEKIEESCGKSERKLWKVQICVSCGKNRGKLWKNQMEVVEKIDESCGKNRRKLWKNQMEVVENL